MLRNYHFRPCRVYTSCNSTSFVFIPANGTCRIHANSPCDDVAYRILWVTQIAGLWFSNSGTAERWILVGGVLCPMVRVGAIIHIAHRCNFLSSWQMAQLVPHCQKLLTINFKHCLTRAGNLSCTNILPYVWAQVWSLQEAGSWMGICCIRS